MAAKNLITGDTIATRPYSDKYGEGHDRIWGKKVPENKGHGHVTPRPDGVKARCGGPALCSVCREEYERIHCRA